mmetsp:Transcript_31605/g.83478  ORF Transcript_31605/g.83478 Transcript_31605/m.83478 type:complete len:276 (-) Transcript_31605:100-927(-)
MRRGGVALSGGDVDSDAVGGDNAALLRLFGRRDVLQRTRFQVIETPECKELEKVGDDEPNDVVKPDATHVGPRDWVGGGEVILPKRHDRADDVGTEDGDEERHAGGLRSKDEALGAAREHEELNGNGNLKPEAALLVVLATRVVRAAVVVAIPLIGRNADVIAGSRVVKEKGLRREDATKPERHNQEAAQRRHVRLKRRARVVGGNRSHGDVVEESEEDNVDRLEERVVDENENSEHEHDLDRGGEAVEHVGTQALENLARLDHGRVDGAETGGS